MCGDTFWSAWGGIQCLTLPTAVANVQRAILCSWILRPQVVEGHLPLPTPHPQPPGPPLLSVCCPYYFWKDEPKPYQSVFWEHEKWRKKKKPNHAFPHFQGLKEYWWPLRGITSFASVGLLSHTCACSCFCQATASEIIALPIRGVTLFCKQSAWNLFLEHIIGPRWCLQFEIDSLGRVNTE